MKIKIRAKCHECDFSGFYKEVYNHSVKDHDGTTSVRLNKEDIVNAIIQFAIKDMVKNITTYDKSIYKNLLDYWCDWDANDVYNLFDDGDDVVDVVESFKNDNDLLKQFSEHLKKFKFIQEMSSKPKVISVVTNE